MKKKVVEIKDSEIKKTPKPVLTKHGRIEDITKAKKGIRPDGGGVPRTRV